MSMRGIDISTYQRGLDLGNIDFDFAIIKATEGTELVQDTCDPWVQQCIQLGKRWGFYHFFAGGDPVKEAEFFVSNTKNYFGKGKGVAVVDYESYGMTGAANVKKFVERVHELTGVWCVIYMSRSVIKADDWSAIAPTCPLWVAQYANDEIVNGHQSDPWIQDGGFGPWASPIIHQYTSHGRLDGWGKNLDLDKAYITAEEWDALAAGDKAQDKPATEDKPQPSTPSTGGVGTQKTYTVKSGDSWWLIAEKQMGSGSKMHELAAANGKTIDDVIHPGDVLKIPGGTSKPSTGGGSTQKTYTVKSGDSWWLIAEKQMGSGSKMHELAAANGKTIDDVIHPGDVLKIPGGTSKPSTGGGSTQKTYTVKSGDSWWLIAEKQMGSGSKMHELAAANGKTINDVIHPGDVLKIPC